MTCFGLGPIPGMVGAGFGGRLISVGARQSLFQVAAWSHIVAGGVSVWRGVAFLQTSPDNPACPFCRPNQL